MSEIDITRFIDVSMVTNVHSMTLGTRGILTLYTPEGTSTTPPKKFNSYAEAVKTLDSTNYAQTLKYLEIYFNHGGSSVVLIEATAHTAVTIEMIKALPIEQILVGFVIPDASVTTGFSAIITLATAYNATYDSSNTFDVYRKIFFVRTTDNSVTTEVPCLGVKYSTVFGADMTMAAYLSKIDVYGQNTVNDYAFTLETIAEENVTDQQLGTTLTNNMNVDVSIGNGIRNLGGNLKDGADLTNTFVLIVLVQTLTNQLLDLLVQKLKNSTGISKIYTAIIQELDAYRASGYFSTDKRWDKDTLTIEKNHNIYTIIEKGTALLNGYYVKVLPFSSLEEADIVARKAPYIYVIVADQYGIRKITINGEVV